MAGVRLIVSDAHSGLAAARQAVTTSRDLRSLAPCHGDDASSRKRERVHLQQNATAYVPRQEMKATVAAGIRAIFNAPDRVAAETLLKEQVALYLSSAPRLADWMEANLPQGLSVFRLPEAHRRLLRTSNGLERVNEEGKRRTRVATLFPSEVSCLRLVSAVLMEISDEWETGKAYLTFERTG